MLERRLQGDPAQRRQVVGQLRVCLPGALALYYTVSNLIATAQQHYLLNKDSEEMEDLTEEVIEKPKKSVKTKAQRRADKASEAHVTRIKAKG